jgi:hypothetical protein
MILGMISKKPEAVIGRLYHTHTHDCWTRKSFSKNQRTIIKPNFSLPPFGIRVSNRAWNTRHMPILCSFGHEKQGHFRQATRGVWRRMCLIALGRQMGQSLSWGSYITWRWCPIRKTSNSRWSRTQPCQAPMRALWIWLSYGMRSRSIQIYVLEVLKKSLGWKTTHYVGLRPFSMTIKKLRGFKWQPQCWAFSNHCLHMLVLGH